MRYKCIVAYDGYNYVGFQSQINGTAIQDVIEDKLKIIFNDSIRIVMASRTDSGVHAKGQVFHVDALKEVEPFRLKGSLNGLLPKDIHINSVEVVDENFHSRFNVKAKKYEYVINTGEYDVFLRNRAYQCFYKLDIDLLKEGAALFEGRHDFGSFNTCSYEDYPDQVREIYSMKVIKRDNLLIIEVVGDGFLRHMVRMIVGTLIDLARGQKSLETVKDMINHPCKSTHRYNIDPGGLYLSEIYY